MTEPQTHHSSAGEEHGGAHEPAESGNPIREAIAEAITEHPVILFMKGNPEQPACGFSARTVGALQSLGASFAAVDILPDPRIRQELSALSQWPTIPQLFINGELIGGADIVAEMYESGELAAALGIEGSGDEGAGELESAGTPEATASPGPAPLPVENRLN
jgi:monothiol glutaredoxin